MCECGGVSLEDNEGLVRVGIASREGPKEKVGVLEVFLIKTVARGHASLLQEIG